MKDAINEQLSALLDDELAEAEQSLLLRQLAKSGDLRSRLSRYQLISDAIHDNLPAQVDPEFHARVLAGLPDQTPGHPAAAELRKLYRPLAGLALAASVAVVAVVSLQNSRVQAPSATPVVASAPAPEDYIRAEHAPQSSAHTRDATGLDIYLVNHNEYAVNRGMQGMLPYVRIVGHDAPPSVSNPTHE